MNRLKELSSRLAIGMRDRILLSEIDDLLEDEAIRYDQRQDILRSIRKIRRWYEDDQLFSIVKKSMQGYGISWDSGDKTGDIAADLIKTIPLWYELEEIIDFAEMNFMKGNLFADGSILHLILSSPNWKEIDWMVALIIPLLSGGVDDDWIIESQNYFHLWKIIKEMDIKDLVNDDAWKEHTRSILVHHGGDGLSEPIYMFVALDIRVVKNWYDNAFVVRKVLQTCFLDNDEELYEAYFGSNTLDATSEPVKFKLEISLIKEVVQLCIDLQFGCKVEIEELLKERVTNILSLFIENDQLDKYSIQNMEKELFSTL